MIIKRIIKKLLKEYIFVFSLAGVFLALSFCLDDCATLQNWLISISASLFTVPLVFVTYDEYSKSVKEKTYCILYRENQKIINDVFACFLYFTSYFFNPIENPSFDYDVIFTKNIELKKEEIKGKIVSNSFSGFFCFSSFERFDTDLLKILRDPKVINFIDIEEISIILNFISHYETLLGQFNMITDKDFIEDGVYNGCQLKESAIVQDNYDCIYIDPDTEKTMLIYTAAYREIDEAKMNMKIKIAEHKAEEIAKELFALYQQIKRWLEYKGQKTINYESIMIVGGRATADFSIYGNQYFK